MIYLLKNKIYAVFTNTYLLNEEKDPKLDYLKVRNLLLKLLDKDTYDYSIKDGISQTTSTPTQATSSGAATPVTAGLPGTVVKIVSPVGTQVSDGTTILIVEAMKMEVEIKSSVSGSVKEIKVKPGDSIVAGQELAIVG